MDLPQISQNTERNIPNNGKICSRCKLQKDSSCFGSRKEGRGLRSACKTCEKIISYHKSLERKDLPILVTEKRCAICATTKPTADFYRSSYSSDNLQSECKSCHRTRSCGAESAANCRERYQKNKKIINSRRKDITVRNYNFLLQYLYNHPCVDCGEENPLVLQFDHVKDKKTAVTLLAIHGASLTSIKKEIIKCEVRCANCHSIKTAKQFGFLRYKILDELL